MKKPHRDAVSDACEDVENHIEDMDISEMAVKKDDDDAWRNPVRRPDAWHSDTTVYIAAPGICFFMTVNMSSKDKVSSHTVRFYQTALL